MSVIEGKGMKEDGTEDTAAHNVPERMGIGECGNTVNKSRREELEPRCELRLP